MQYIKLTVVGDDIRRRSSYLKAELLETYATGVYPAEYIPTVFNNTSVYKTIEGKSISIGLWDTSGQSDYDRLRPLSYPQTDVFMIVFSVASPQSLENVVVKWWPEVSHHCPQVPLLLVGCNARKRSHPKYIARLKEKSFNFVTIEQGETVAKEIGAVAYRECDAYTQVGVEEAFTTAIRAALYHHHMSSPSSSRGGGGGGSKPKIAQSNYFPPMNTIYKEMIAKSAGKLEAIRPLRAMLDPTSALMEELHKVLNEAVESLVKLSVKGLDLRDCLIDTLPLHYLPKFKALELLVLSGNRLSEFICGPLSTWKMVALDLSRNCFTAFPINLQLFPSLNFISLAHNSISFLPEYIAEYPRLQLDVSYNKITSLPPGLLTMDIDATGNPLSGMMPAYRGDKNKLLMFLKNTQVQPTVEWKQVKLMLLGQEEVGKTTLLRALQKEKINPSDNISTNGVKITKLTLEHASSSLLNKITKKSPSQRALFSVFDFGGQAVFHSTHRFFITPFAIYAVLYDMSKPETRERVRYWLNQIGALEDYEGTKPIVIVGTHLDLVKKPERIPLVAEMEALYPAPLPNKPNRSQIMGHFAVSTVGGGGLAELTNKLVDLALGHPKIGVGQVRVPKSLEVLNSELERLRSEKSYFKWADYVIVCEKLGITGESIQENTTMLHDIGTIVWHNVPKLRDVVIIDPQWLADAMAGVVSFICQVSVSKTRGMTDWHKLKESLMLKFPAAVHPTAISMLEFFEIVYRMKTTQGLKALQHESGAINNDQMFFVPSLLSPFAAEEDHPTLRHWHSMEASRTFVRRFSWKFYPAGFFPRLLLRLVHLRGQVQGPIACWLDAAIFMGRYGDECAFLQLARAPHDDMFVLEVQVKVEELTEREDSLVASLAYVISRLHKDMYHQGRSSDIPLIHHVVLPNQAVIQFENCIRAEIEGKAFVNVAGQPVRLSQVLPDLNGCKQIPDGALQIQQQIGEGGFGVVHKGIMKAQQDIDGSSHSIVVAVKEVRSLIAEDSSAFYDFLHEATIMSKLHHVNLVQMHGITKSPLRMVMEFVPKSDLHKLLIKRKPLSLKYKLKVAIDCASGVSYLHSQSPAICHSDLRAPNVFLASLDESAQIVAKVADFGLSQQMFPFSQQTLHNILETAPETWDGGFYDEKSDVFSYAVLLWRLFGSNAQNAPPDLATSESAVGDETPKEEDDTDESEYEYLKENGKIVPTPKQREIIRLGGRPPIHSVCSPSMKTIISDCWMILPESRPSFFDILMRLFHIYTDLFSEDEYVQRKRRELINEDLILSPHRTVEHCFLQSAFQPDNWQPITVDEFAGTATSFLDLETEVWVGTSAGGLAMFDKKSGQFIRYTPLHQQQENDPRVSTKRTVLMSVGSNCVWAAVGSEVNILSTKTRNYITSKLQHNHAIASMVLLPSMFVWVADTEGFISIWDAQTLQKCYRFKIHPQNCAQSMAMLHNYVCVAVGRELLAVNIHTLNIIQAETALGDRIHSIVTVANENQVWTCTRDGYVTMWRLAAPTPLSSELTDSKNNLKEISIKLEHKWQLNTPPKSICVFSDQGHVCAGTFDGSVFVWNVQTLQQHSIPMPSGTSGHNVACVLDTQYALWCGIEGTHHQLLFHKHAKVSEQSSSLACRQHGRKYHDVFLNYRVYSEGSTSLLYPIETMFNTISLQKKKKSIGEVSVFWDVKCLNYGQNWERSFFQALTNAKVVVLLISKEALEGIKKNSAQKQDNVLVEYECAILQNKIKKTPVIPVFVAEAHKAMDGSISFTPFDFKYLNPSDFPSVTHARGDDIQFVVDDMSKSLNEHDCKFLHSVASTIDQIRKLQGYMMAKRGQDEQELMPIVEQIMVEVEK